MSSYTCIYAVHENSNLAYELLTYCTTPSRSLDLPGTFDDEGNVVMKPFTPELYRYVINRAEEEIMHIKNYLESLKLELSTLTETRCDIIANIKENSKINLENALDKVNEEINNLKQQIHRLESGDYEDYSTVDWVSLKREFEYVWGNRPDSFINQDWKLMYTRD